MITDNEIEEIKKQLEEAENPLVFFDDDHDGLASFILLKKKYDKCKGVVLKVSVKEEDIYLRKIKEYKPDKIFVLDRPELSQELVDKINIPIIWIDHHTPVEIKGVRYYNPRIHNKGDKRPVSYWCYKITNQDMWVALTGIIGDWFVTEFIDEFEYKDLFEGKREIKEILYESRFGMLVKVFNFILKGKTSDVNRYINILIKIKDPYEILDGKSERGKFLNKAYLRINKIYEELLNKAVKEGSKEKVLVFIYPKNKLSLTGILSNELTYKFPDKIIIVGRKKDSTLSLSLRSSKIVILPIIKKALKDVEGFGGGHELACGAQIAEKDYGKFIEKIKEEVERVK